MMNRNDCCNDPGCDKPGERKREGNAHRGKHWSRFLLLPIIGTAALFWLIFRSGSKPSRITYPCQQAALSTATLALSAPMIVQILALFRKAIIRFFTPLRIALAFGMLFLIIGVRSDGWNPNPYRMPLPPALNASAYAAGFSGLTDYRAQVFHKTGCPQNPAGDRFQGLEDLIMMMGAQNLKFYKSTCENLVSGPAGIIAADDTVIIKINYQWSQRGGTNTDLLRGLIRQIIDHPDTFTGEIVVCENAQFNSTSDFDRAENNAQDHSLSPHDVVAYFQSLGYRVSHYDWTPIRTIKVNEFSTGDMNNGYIVEAFIPQLLSAPSYPKFTTAYGTRISLRYGIYDQGSNSYDRTHFKFINLPVLKSHHSTYGATACVKHYMGVVTRELSTNSHSGIRYGILGKVMGEIHPADLNILDCIWINANPNSGPSTMYTEATRRDELVASLDPVAADIWADKYILIPGFYSNGYSPPWPTPSADPDDPASAFRIYLDNSMNQIIQAGYQVTNDLTKIDLFNAAPPGEASDPEGPGDPFTIEKESSGYTLAWSQAFTGGVATEYNLYRIPLSAMHGNFEPVCEAKLGSGVTAYLPSLSDNCGFLVVGRNAGGDGLFGKDSAGIDRLKARSCSICP